MFRVIEEKVECHFCEELFSVIPTAYVKTTEQNSTSFKEKIISVEVYEEASNHLP